MKAIMIYHFKEIAIQAIQGATDPLIAYAELKGYKQELDQAIKDLEPVALDESEKYGKSFELHGIRFERRNGATRYDFKHLDKWQQLNTALKDFEKNSKHSLAAAKYGGNYIDENGEEIPVPHVTFNKDSLVVK